MNIEQLLAKSTIGQIQFQEVMDHIAAHYDYHPTSFQNGSLKNLKDENQGSAKLLYFAQLNELSKEDTLRLFAEHYLNVLDNPTGEGHQNIRQFMANGWAGVVFEQAVLSAK